MTDVETPSPPPAAWTCTFQDLPEHITVGQELRLHCQGDTGALDGSHLQFVFPEKFEYTLAWLKSENWQKGEADLIVTSYRPGEHRLQQFSITDGKIKVLAQATPLHVESVIDPQQPVSEPYGPIGPFRLTIPAYVWLSLALTLALAALAIGRAFKKNIERRKWLKEIEESQGADQAFFNFNKTLRTLNRKYAWSGKAAPAPDDQANTFVAELEDAFRLFLAQTLLVPFHQWPLKTSMRELRRRQNWFYRLHHHELRRLLQELEKARQPAKPLTELDCAQLLELCRKRADQIWAVTEQRKQAKR